MGNSNSQDNRGNIFVRTDKPYYFAGELVTGTVYLNIWNNGFPGVQIHLKIKGKEFCHWEESRTVTESKGKGQTRTRRHVDHYYGNNQFFCHKFILHTFVGKTMPAGQYAFPFSFHLLPSLPGSFFEQGFQYKASIRYKVKSEVESYEKSTKNIKHTQEFIVREPLRSNIQPLAGEVRLNAKTWCCIKQGECSMKCVFDKNHYLPGERASLWVDIDNSECKLDVKQIRAVLTNFLTLRSTCGRQKVVQQQLSTEIIEGIQAGSHAKDEDRKMMQINLINQRNPNDPNLKPSTNGNIVRSVYELSGTAVLDGCTCCNSDPKVSVPIMIVAPVPISYNSVQQPSNWNPQTFEPQLIIFNDTNLYAKPQGQNQGYNYPSSSNQKIDLMNQNM